LQLSNLKRVLHLALSIRLDLSTFFLLGMFTQARTQLLNCNTWYLALHPVSGEIVGCGGWTFRSPAKSSEGSDTPKPVPHLRHFAVHPDHTRKGIANALFDRTWQDACSVMGPLTTLEVFSTITAVAFYGSLGFEVVEHLQQPLTKDSLFPCVLMRREAPST
jgi:ribosomal protein S18 acetylase RimI-like enzyme